MLDTTDYEKVKTGFENWHVDGTNTDYALPERMTLVSAELVDGRIEIVRRYSPGICCTPSPPDRIEKEIYTGSDLWGITLYETIKGRIVPGYYIDEQIEFEEQP